MRHIACATFSLTLVVSQFVGVRGTYAADESTAAVQSAERTQFTLNPGLKARCEFVPDRCEVPYEYLKKFRAEPRDSQWAGHIEPALRSALLVKDPNIVFRHLECRTTVCVVEYTTLENVRYFQPPAPLGDQIHRTQDVVALEYLPDGTPRRDVFGFYCRLPR
jgi:hypothetical protein